MKQRWHWIAWGVVLFLVFDLVFFLGKVSKMEGTLAGVSLPTVEGGAAQDLGSCPAPKCLTVYLSPWCTICRASTPLLKALPPWLGERGIPARIVVGRDKESEVLSYAQEFGAGTFVDVNSEFPLRGGVPSFVVSDGTGKILKILPGVPRIYTEPIRNEYLAEVAKFLDLI